jgi:site-specific DNA recombinase
MKSIQYSSNSAVDYARVSSDEQEKEGFSIPAQTKLLKGYAAREGIDVVKDYVDVETAKVPGRPGFNEMVEFFQQQSKIKDPQRRCRILLVEKTDRLYRNLKDYVTIDELDVEIHFVKEGVILSPESHSSEKFMHLIKVGMAKAYVENLGEEVKKGMREKAEQGIWPCQAPTGYLNVVLPSGKKGIEPDPVAAPIVSKMFEWYATSNYAFAKVARMAEAAGLKFGRKDNLAATVHNMLKNPIYYGDFRFVGKMYRGIHTPLVTRELWAHVQEVRKSRGTRKPRRVKHNFAFSNLIECGHCGCSLVGELKKQKYIYYHCTGYKGKCDEPYVREEVLEERFTEVLRSLRFDDEILELVSSALRQSHVDEKQFHDEAIDRLQGEYKRLQNRIDQMYIDKLDGRVTVEFFDQKSEEWRQEQQAILHNLDQHQNANQSYLEEGVAILELANRAVELFEKQPASEKRLLLDFVVSNSTWANGELKVDFRQPFDLIAVGVTESKQMKVAGVLTDDLHPAMYTPLDSNQ